MCLPTHFVALEWFLICGFRRFPEPKPFRSNTVESIVIYFCPSPPFVIGFLSYLRPWFFRRDPFCDFFPQVLSKTTSSLPLFPELKFTSPLHSLIHRLPKASFQCRWFILLPQFFAVPLFLFSNFLFSPYPVPIRTCYTLSPFPFSDQF